MNTKEQIRKSKYLSLLLRHQPQVAGIQLDTSGWTNVEVLLERTGISKAELEEIVSNNNKSRFEFSLDKTKIRASQGHSVEVDLGYDEKTPTSNLFHGTSRLFLSSIQKEGLLKRDRHHVHLSEDKETARTVAKRRSYPIILEIDAVQMCHNGHKFYLSTNGVWLTECVPSGFIRLLSD